MKTKTRTQKVLERAQAKEKARTNCISTRLSDEEFDDLLQVCDKTSRTVAELVREAVSSYLGRADHEGTGGNH